MSRCVQTLTLVPLLVMVLICPDQPQWSSVLVDHYFTFKIHSQFHTACSFIVLVFLNSNHIYIFLLFDFLAKNTFLWPEMQKKICCHIVRPTSIVVAILVNDFATLHPVNGSNDCPCRLGLLTTQMNTVISAMLIQTKPSSCCSCFQ